MFIRHVILRGFIAFRFAQITELDVCFTDFLQVVLGTNGSGKSSLLRQLSPSPPIRTHFGPNGYKELIVEHRGSVFRIVSDFSRKEAPHEFWDDNTNLNEGGTTDVQRDLIAHHLGWTADVEQLCFNGFNFTDVGPTVREGVFMRTNPDRIDFILAYAKKTRSLIKASKAVLARLQDRRVQLESQMIPDDQFATLRAEAARLTEEASKLSGIIYRIGIAKQNFNKYSGRSADPSVLDHIKGPCRTLLNNAHMFSEIPRDRIPEYREDLDRRVIEGTTRKDELIHSAESLAEKLRTLREQAASYDNALDISELKATITSDQTRLAACEKLSVANPLTQDTLSSREQIMLELQTLMRTFLELPRPLHTRRKIRAKQRSVSYWNGVLQEHRRILRDTESAMQRCESSLSLRRVDIPDTPCAKSACPLWVNFVEGVSSVEDKLRTLQSEREQVLARIHRLEHWLYKQNEQLTVYQPVFSALSTVASFTESYPELASFFKAGNTLDRLSTNPMGIYYQIEAHFDRSTHTHEIPKIKERLLRHELALEKAMVSTEGDMKSVLTALNDVEKELSTRQARITAESEQLAVLEKRKQTLSSYESALDWLQEKDKALNDYIDLQLIFHDHQKLGAILDYMSACHNDVLTRLADINKNLRDQDSIRDRYNNEIMTQIAAEDAELIKLNQLLHGLIEVPRVNTLTFLNTVIRSVNKVIRKVFTYDFRLLPLNKEGNVDYKFPYSVGTAEGSDISNCSTAQKEITNLAFTLACRMQKQMHDYPLFLDEVGSTFDFAHQQKLLDLIVHIVDEKLASQIFLINHHAVIHDGLTNTETLVLHEANIMKTERYNTHAVILRD